jgi:hypothetical protein
MDPLLRRLKESGVGCFVGDLFCGCLGYADDVVMLAPTMNSLRTQLRICTQYAEEFMVSFNATKSKVICVRSNKTSLPPEAPVTFMGGIIEFVPSGTHLGSPIGNFSPEDVITTAVSDFHRRVGMLRGHFKWLHPTAKYALFKSFCMPLYGCVLWDYAHPSMERFHVAWRKAIRALLGLPLRTHCALLPDICGDSDVSMQLLSRCFNFFKSLANSPNILVRSCFSVARLSDVL